MAPTARYATTLLCLLVSAYAAFVYGVLPFGSLVHPDMREAFQANALAIRMHVFASLAALALGPLQFSERLRRARPRLHRIAGRLYLGIGVGVGGLSALYLSQHAHGGAIGRAGFALLALAWLYTGLQGYRAIRRGDVAAHREWMSRNFALTFAAVTLRLYLPLSVALGVPFDLAYPAIAWLCWVPNLVAVHLHRRRGRHPWSYGRRRAVL